MINPVERAERVIEFIETYCRIPEGAKVGQPLILEEFQKDWIRRIYANPAGTRLAIISIARKNGKTALVAALFLAHLVGPEARRNQQMYSAAQSRDQAAVVFALAAKMIRMSPELNDIVSIKDSAKEFVSSLTGSFYKALSAESKTAHGKSPAFFLFDELGQTRGPRSELLASLMTGQGAHDAPLAIIISTQAATDADILSIMIDDARRANDPKTVCIVHEAPKDADLLDESAWIAANPALARLIHEGNLASAIGRA